MRKHPNLAIVQRVHFRALKSDSARDGSGVEGSAPDEPQDGYPMAMKRFGHFVHGHKMGICFRN
jgi:hypothetical protein